MAKQGGEKFTWVIKDFCSLQSETFYSDIYETGGCKWLSANFLEINPEILYVNLISTYGPSKPTERRRYFKYHLTIVNQLSEDLSILKEGLHLFDSSTMDLGFASTFYISKVHEKDGGFLVNDEVKIIGEVDVLEVIDKSDISDEFEKTTRTPIKREENDGDVSTVLLKEASTIKESIDVNGFQVFPSQVESVKRIFERHPGIAVGFPLKNQHLRNSYMFSLLSIIETLCKSFQELSNEDFVEADIALSHVKAAGFKVDWLEKKLKQVKAKKEKQMSGLAELQEREQNLLKMKQKCAELDALVEEQKQKCAELDALVEEQKEELSATITSLSFDDVV